MGPVLYLLYTKPLVDVIRSHGLDYYMYANDNQLYLSFATQDVDQAKSKIKECITSICKWMGVNELKLNHDKTEIMMFHSKFRVRAVQSLRVGMENVNLSSFAKSLGVTFDDTMSFDNQISNVCKSSFYSLRNISRIRKYLDKESAATLIHAYITSKLDYCNSLLVGVPKFQLQRLQYVQNAAPRVVCQGRKYNHINYTNVTRTPLVTYSL